MTLATRGITSLIPEWLAVQQTARPTAAAPFVAFRGIGDVGRLARGPVGSAPAPVLFDFLNGTNPWRAEPDKDHVLVEFAPGVESSVQETIEAPMVAPPTKR